MPEIRIDVSDALLARLQVLVAEYNVRNGTSLTAAQWVKLHLRELAVQRELVAKAGEIERQAQADAAAAVEAEKQRLLGLV